MKRGVKTFICSLIALTVSVWLVIPASAADASVIYDGDAQKFIFAPGSSDSPTDLFNSFKGVMPGDSLTQKITVRNAASNKVKVKLYLRSLGAQEAEDFLSQMHLTVTQDGESELFAAPASQTAGLTDWVCLGTFYSGADIDLQVVLDVPLTMDNAFQDAVGKLDWQFKVEELPVDPDDPKPPQTGEQTSVWLYAGIFLAGAGGFLLLLPAAKGKKAAERRGRQVPAGL